MFKFRKKKLIYPVSIIVLVLSICFSIPSISSPLLNILKNPATILTFFMREVKGIIFYHRNFIQNEQLNDELGLLTQKLNSQRELYFENERLRKLLYLKQQAAFKVTAARVIARSDDSWSSSVVIDKGRHSGVRRAMVAISYSGLVGRVVEAEDFTSKVLLISDPNLSVSAIVQRSRQEGLVCGTLGANLIMKYLPENSDIKVQDTIVTSGLNEAYPKGVLIGTVIGLGKDFSGLSHYAIIKPAVNLSNIEEVLIIIP